jgi:glycosyltransferase involved in cell wall biosynthesis
MIKDRVEVGIGLYVWNGDKTIHQTLSSIINQTYKNIKIYILDNQSTDKTTEIVKKFQKQDKRVNLIIDKKKRDQAAAPRFLLNQFLKKYKYCLIISDDDIYEKKFIEVVLNKLINKKLNMVYPYFNLIDLKHIEVYNSNELYTLYSFKPPNLIIIGLFLYRLFHVP